MPSFAELFAANIDLAALAILIISIPVFVLFTLRARAGYRFHLRPLAAYARISQLASHATESGRAIHVALGSGRIGGEATPEAMMGLAVFDYVARHTGPHGHSAQATAADPTILASAQGILHTARSESGYPEMYTGRDVQFSGPQPFAYAAGALEAVADKEPLAIFLLGQFNAEGMWLSEAGGSRGILELGGTAEPAGAALMSLSLDEAIVGEELFAAGAYLHRPLHLGSLAAQDFLRIVIILTILAGVAMRSLGYW